MALCVDRRKSYSVAAFRAGEVRKAVQLFNKSTLGDLGDYQRHAEADALLHLIAALLPGDGLTAQCLIDSNLRWLVLHDVPDFWGAAKRKEMLYPCGLQSAIKQLLLRWVASTAAEPYLQEAPQEWHALGVMRREDAKYRDDIHDWSHEER